jgi:hypothetical protein
LQLANFWQDVSADYAKSRIYLPLEDLRRFGVSEVEIRAARNTSAFREMMRFEVDRAREWFAQGLPLSSEVNRELAVDIELFSRGGLEILNAIERQDYAVLGRRPAISKSRNRRHWSLALQGEVVVCRRGMRLHFSPTPSQLDVAYCASHRALRCPKFLLRIRRPASPQTQFTQRGVCVHAALR